MPRSCNVRTCHTCIESRLHADSHRLVNEAHVCAALLLMLKHTFTFLAQVSDCDHIRASYSNLPLWSGPDADSMHDVRLVC